MILISVDDHIYEVSGYQKQHPGEGINSIYIHKFNKKNVSNLFDKYHLSNDSYTMLEQAREKGSYNDIYYVCPNFFGERRIPKYFYFSNIDPYAKEFMKDKPNMTFIMRKSNSNSENSLCITYKNEDEICQLKVRRLDNKWICNWEDEEGEIYEIICENISKIIDKTMIENGYEAINI